MASKKINRWWIVAPLDLKGNAKFWYGNPIPEEDRVQEAAPRAARRNALDEEVQIGNDGGFGQGLETKEAREVMIFTSENKANEYAEDLAGKRPKELFGVFSCVQVFETTTPQVIRKQFNDSGELKIKE